MQESHGGVVSLESVLCTEQLDQRPSRPPDYQAEIQAVVVLLAELKNAPRTVLQRLVDTALELCRGHSAGISLLEEGAPGQLSAKGDHFRWHAVAGEWAPLIWNTTTQRDNGPCGTVLDRNCTLLFANAHRYYAQFAGVEPLLVEGLLVPFHVDGEAVGTVWVVAHDDSRKFDAEDRRMLESLAAFAATAYQVLRNLNVLQQQAEALRDADRRKSEFLAMLAHELRNPLAPIRHAVEILRLSGDDEQHAKPATEMMHRQVGQMDRLISDLLDVSRIDRGKLELRNELIELASVVRQAVEAARPLCESLGHALTITVSPEPIYLDADLARLAQVVGNLVNNACKFTERGGHIRLTAERESGRADRAVIRVEDNGIGIAAELLPRIFDMFSQGDTSLDRSRDGLGIGLTLAKSIVEMQGGTVEARSAGLGRGSEFIVRLPIVAGADHRPSELFEGKQAGATPPVQRRVLVVDDNADAADALAMLLKLSGHEVHTAYDGLQALEVAEKIQPEVILLDLGLPKIDGYEAARRIREQQQHRRVTLVALSGWEEDRRRSEEAGFDLHMVKPLDPQALAKVLGQSVAR